MSSSAADSVFTSPDVAQALSQGGRAGTLRFPGSPQDPAGIDAGETPEPERLFAGAYAACFQSALMAVAGKLGIALSGCVLSAKVALIDDATGGKRLAVELHACMPAIERPQALHLMEEAHKICPYSKALRGEATVSLKVD